MPTIWPRSLICDVLEVTQQVEPGSGLLRSTAFGVVLGGAGVRSSSFHCQGSSVFPRCRAGVRSSSFHGLRRRPGAGGAGVRSSSFHGLRRRPVSGEWPSGSRRPGVRSCNHAFAAVETVRSSPFHHTTAPCERGERKLPLSRSRASFSGLPAGLLPGSGRGGGGVCRAGQAANRGLDAAAGPADPEPPISRCQHSGQNTISSPVPSDSSRQSSPGVQEFVTWQVRYSGSSGSSRTRPRYLRRRSTWLS